MCWWGKYLHLWLIFSLVIQYIEYETKQAKEGGDFQRTGGALGFIFNSTLALTQSLYETLPAYYLSHPPQK